MEEPLHEDERMDGEGCSGAVCVDESSLLRTLRDVLQRFVVTQKPADDATGKSHDEILEEMEPRLEAFWDLCVDEQTSAFVVKHKAISILAGAASRTEGRISEVCLGALGNICSHSGVVKDLHADDVKELCAVADFASGVEDGLVVLQALRLAFALLCGPASINCFSSLWSEDTVKKYLFTLENTLRWEVFQLCCNVISQGIQIESEADDSLNRFRAIPMLADVELGPLVATRTQELLKEIALAAQDEGLEVDPEVLDSALTSALRLIDDSLVVLPCSPEAIQIVGSAALAAVVTSQEEEVMMEALEILSSLFQLSVDGSGKARHREALVHLHNSVEQCGAKTNGIAEKLGLLFANKEHAMDCAAPALLLLQAAPWAEVVDYRDVVARVAFGLQPSKAPGGVSADFLACLEGRSC